MEFGLGVRDGIAGSAHAELSHVPIRLGHVPTTAAPRHEAHVTLGRETGVVRAEMTPIRPSH